MDMILRSVTFLLFLEFLPNYIANTLALITAVLGVLFPLYMIAGIIANLLGKDFKFDMYILVFLGICFLVLVFILIPGHKRYKQAKSRVYLSQCRASCKNIAMALKMYADDNEGLYPKSLLQLTPNYLRSMPQCAVAEKETYSISYQSSVNPPDFSFYCAGHHHKWADVPPNYPQYNSNTELNLLPDSLIKKTIKTEQ